MTFSNGELIGDVKGRMERRKEYFRGLLNVDKILDRKLIESISTVVNDTEEPLPSKEEILAAIKILKNHKAPGVDEINAEILKAGGESMAKVIKRIIEKDWNEERVPEDWKKAVI